MARAQVAMEFVILIAVAFMVMLVFVGFAREYSVDVKDQTEYVLVKDISYYVQGEINLATSVEDGYSRTFTVPEKIEGTAYTIYIDSGLLWVKTNSSEYVAELPDIVGSIKKGNNTITRQAGIVYLNTEANGSITPDVDLISPPNGSTDSDGNVSFGYVVEDIDSGIANCSLILNGLTNQTAYNITEGILQDFVVNNMQSGNYTWAVSCIDDSADANIGVSETWNLEVI